MITFKAKDKNGDIINSALKPFTFPAGETHIKVSEHREIEPVEIAIWQPSATSLNNDLLHIGMWINLLQQKKYQDTKTVLIMPYIPAARMDRGEPFGLAVYANIINGFEIDQIICYDPHSQSGAHLIKGYEKTRFRYPEDLLDGHHSGYFPIDRTLFSGIIAPDKGATLRAQGVADAFRLPLYVAEKTRDFSTGKLTGFALHGLPETGRFLLVDDICDGGGTFLGLAGALGLLPDNLHLYVSHGVFSGEALKNLPEKFGRIYTTNSYDPQRELNVLPEALYGKPFVRIDVIRELLYSIAY